MRKNLSILLFILMVAAAVGIYYYQNLEPFRDVPRVTLSSLNTSVANWYENSVDSYHILTSVKFGLEQRRYELTIRDGLIEDAVSSTWDETNNAWSDYSVYSREEAEFFTVPGMYTLVRTELLNDEIRREVLRLAVNAEYSYPEIIYFGDIYQDELLVEETDLVIEVLEFEILNP